MQFKRFFPCTYGKIFCTVGKNNTPGRIDYQAGYSVVRSTSPLDNRAIWLEIFAGGIHKGNSCQTLLKKLNINCKEVAGLGNDYNDIDFLDICAEAYLVANAPVNLQRHYKLVKSDKEEGFTEFISKVL